MAETVDRGTWDWVTTEMFDEALEKIVRKHGAGILYVPGVYEVLSEHFNNEVLDTLEAARELEKGEDHG